MSRKPKFRPIITRIKLNPEQAVLSCRCWDNMGCSWYPTLDVVTPGSQLDMCVVDGGKVKQLAYTGGVFRAGTIGSWQSSGATTSS